MLKNYNLAQPDGSWERFSGEDDRYIYPDGDQIEYTERNAYVLANNSEGWGAIGNITLIAEPVKRLNIMAAYTLTESKEVSGMPGSAAYSAYNGQIQVNGPHLPMVHQLQLIPALLGSHCHNLTKGRGARWKLLSRSITW